MSKNTGQDEIKITPVQDKLLTIDPHNCWKHKNPINIVCLPTPTGKLEGCYPRPDSRFCTMPTFGSV